MLNRISRFLESRLHNAGGDPEPLDTKDKQIASAALLMEVAAADNVLQAREMDAFSQAMQTSFGLTDEEIALLQKNAENKQENATSLFQFTQIVNNSFSREEKFNLVKSMWQIALADDELDKYEEHIIRRVAELIYLSHTDFLVARNAARES